MTPKEKAISIVKKMSISDSIQLNRNQYGIQCALIAVDEILDTKIHIMEDISTEEVVKFVESRIIYWQEVKKEIDKL